MFVVVHWVWTTCLQSRRIRDIQRNRDEWTECPKMKIKMGNTSKYNSKLETVYGLNGNKY